MKTKYNWKSQTTPNRLTAQRSAFTNLIIIRIASSGIYTSLAKIYSTFNKFA